MNGENTITQLLNKAIGEKITVMRAVSILKSHISDFLIIIKELLSLLVVKLKVNFSMKPLEL